MTIIHHFVLEISKLKNLIIRYKYKEVSGSCHDRILSHLSIQCSLNLIIADKDFIL